MKTERILTLLRQSYAKDAVKRIVLVHLLDGQEDVVREWSTKDISLAEYPGLAEEIFNAAQSITDECQHPERFKIVGYDGKKKAICKNIIRQVPDKEHQNLEPNANGLIALAMQQTKEAMQETKGL